VKQSGTRDTPQPDFANWVKAALGEMRESQGVKTSLFNSSVTEPTALLSTLISNSFMNGPPESYQSNFLRNHPGLEAGLSRRYDVSTQHILCTTGATSAISFVGSALCAPQSHVVIERPGFDIFKMITDQLGLKASFFSRKAPAFEIRTDDVLAELTPDTRMIIVTDLHNPSGIATRTETLEELAGALEKRNVMLLIDEVYRDYAEDFTGGVNICAHPNVIRIGSMTKNFGLNVLRCGWIFTGDRLMPRLRRQFERVDFTTSKLSHTIASEVLSQSEAFDGWRRTVMTRARPVISNALQSMETAGLIEPGSCINGGICFPKLIGIQDTRHLTRWLSDTHNILPVPGECFGEAGYIRIGFAIDAPLLAEAMDRLAKGISEYRQLMSRKQLSA
jgi:aspartate/methionine/tyrosine aminotransferase